MNESLYEDVFNKCAFKYAMFYFERNYVRGIGSSHVLVGVTHKDQRVHLESGIRN